MNTRGRPRSWSDEDLRRAIAVATSWKDVLRALAMSPTNASSHRRVRQRAWELHLDTSHFVQKQEGVRKDVPVVVEGTPQERRAKASEPRITTANDRFGRPRRWTDDDLRLAVAASTSWAGVHRHIGIAIGGSTYRRLQHHARELGLDTSHFLGQAWHRGISIARRPARPLEEVLVADSSSTNTSHLKHRLLTEGVLAPRCAQCGGAEWNGRPMPLQLDHISGDRSDNRLGNLRLLCPNCHAQTDTWCGKNIGGGGGR